MIRGLAVAVLFAGALPLTGCAWSQRDNRPVWNAFEAHLVPDQTGWFVAALPLTVPAGLLAIITDTLVAHPLQVVDDAADDAGWLWRGGRPDFEERYWSEMGFLPVRAALTPVFFAGSFLGRSMFHVAEVDEVALAEQRAAAEAAARARLLAWLTDLANGRSERFGPVLPQDGGAELPALVQRALAQANALGRLQLYRVAMRAPPALGLPDPMVGLEDPDPVVRYELLQVLPRSATVPPGLVEALRQDPVESVRLLARQRWHEELP